MANDRTLSSETIWSLPNRKSDAWTKDCKIMYSGSKEERFRLFKAEYVKSGTEDVIPIQSYYPTSDYKTIINEVSESFPTNFQTTGNNADFVKQNLIENSYFRRAYSEIVKECILAPKAFTVPKMRKDTGDDGKENLVFDLEVAPYEECFDYYDELTGELRELVWRYEDEKLDYYGNSVTVRVQKTYNMDGIYIEYWDLNMKRVVGLENDFIKNPFKQYSSIPAFVFDSMYGVDYKPIAYDLIEQQLQIENLNFNIENGINFMGTPSWKVKNAISDWSDRSIGPGEIATLIGDEDLESIGGDINISGLDVHMDKQVDKFYRNAGLTPPSLRTEMYGTDSSGVAKLAQSPLINKIKIIMGFHKEPMNKLAKLILLINGMEYKNEKVVPPEDVLPFNLQEVLNTWAVGMNLGLLDDETFWTKYFPELTDVDKKRIRDFFNDRYGGGNLDPVNGVNVDNNAKPAGNKKQATQMTKEERDLSVTK